MNATAQPQTQPSSRKRLLLIALVIFVILGAAYAVWWFIYGASTESTDDAYVHGNLVQITPQVSGTVIDIEADDTEMVTAGQPVIRLDPADAQVAQAQAQAQLAQTVRQVRTLYVQNDALAADVDVKLAEIQRSQADLTRAQSDLSRRQTLAKSGGVSGEEILHAVTALKTAESNLAQSRAGLASSRARLVTNQALTQGTTVATHPDVLESAARLRNAWLTSSRNELPAPVTGMVARRSAQVGQRVAPGTPLMTIVPLNQVWVEANFKEGQLRHMRIGQPVKLVSDLYGTDVVYHGKVAGLDAGTGSAFALLPAQNASGNWIKVVQRVPVRISLDPEELKTHPLRIGLSMNVDVDLSQEQGAPLTPTARTQPAWSTKAFEPSRDAVEQLITKIIQDNMAS